MRLLAAEPFDRFGRYRYVWDLRRSCLGGAPQRILDVGDPFGTVGLLFETDLTVSLDLNAEVGPIPGRHTHLRGSGTVLPFADRSFDLVASHDTFEHLPQSDRAPFLSELLRVSAGPVLLVAPFDDPRTRQCEEIVDAYFTARLGHHLEPLMEHRDAGLPDLGWLRGWLEQRKLPYACFGDGWLHSWLAFWILKAHLVSEGLLDLNRQVDAAYNSFLGDVDRLGPHYRRLVVIRPPDGLPERPLAEPAPAEAADQMLDLMKLGVELADALPRGDDPSLPGTQLRSWITANRAGSESRATLATALETALDATRADMATAPRPVGAPTDTRPLPTISVIVVNLDGAEHLTTLLDSIAALDYPSDLLEVIIVDNGSTDGSLELLEGRAGVRVLPQGRNTGFAPAVSAGVRASEAECVVLVNNDMRVEPDFVRQLVRAYDPQSGYVCVGAKILSWDGEQLDFGESSMNYYGMGNQIGYGLPASSVSVPDRVDLLFACGGAMLVSRAIYLETGGFDEDYFAYFEDVDFGWRLWLLGYRVRLASEARCYHRMHGTSSRFPYHQRLLLYERNALRSIIKNYDASNLPRVFGAALALLVKRASVAGQLDGAAYELGGDDSRTEEASRLALAPVHAVVQVLDDLDQLLAKRAAIQHARVLSDDQLVELFRYPLHPTEPTPQYAGIQDALTKLFDLDRLLERGRASRVLVVTADRVGDKMRGPAIRALEVAKALSGDARVTLASPEPADMDAGLVEIVRYDTPEDLTALAHAADVVVVQGYTLRRHPALRGVPAIVVADLYDPWLFEALEVHRGWAGADLAVHQDVSVLNELLDTGDMFICASERQRDYWLGMLAARGRVDHSTYEADPTLRRLIDVVPFGLPDRLPRHDRPALKGVHPAVAEDDLVVLWGGGAWDWFDPLMVIQGFASVVQQVPNAKLYFLGLQLADDNVAPMKMADRAVELAEQLGLAGKSVLFGDWTAYDEREAFLLEADVAVSAARDLAETRLAFRSRLLDYFWAGLPVVTTEGDVLADVVVEERLGMVVSPGDVTGFAEALIRLLRNPVLRAECSSRALQVAGRFRWSETVAALRGLIREPWHWLEARHRRPGRPSVLTGAIIRDLKDAQARLDDALDVQTQRAELHLGEVLGLLDEKAALTAAVDEARGQIEELEGRVGELDAVIAHQHADLERIRNHPAYRAYQAARQLPRRRTQADDS